MLTGVAEEEEGGVASGVVSVSSSGVVSKCAGYRSNETVSFRPFRSKVKYLAARSITRSIVGWLQWLTDSIIAHKDMRTGRKIFAYIRISPWLISEWYSSEFSHCSLEVCEQY